MASSPVALADFGFRRGCDFDQLWELLPTRMRAMRFRQEAD